MRHLEKFSDLRFPVKGILLVLLGQARSPKRCFCVQTPETYIRGKSSGVQEADGGNTG